MRASEFYDRVTSGGGAVIEELLGLFEENGIRYCVIGGQAVNHYVEPLVSLDLAVTTDQLAAVEALLAGRFEVRRFPHSLSVTPHDSDLRIQVQADPRYGDFLDRAERGDVLGAEMWVAAAQDVLRGKVWAAQEPTRRPSKRRKDLLDIERLVEADPALRELVPSEILARFGP